MTAARAALLAASLATLATTARAAPRVAVHARECPEAQALATSTRDPESGRALTLDVTIAPSPRGFVGRLVVTDGGTVVGAREVEGDTCQDVVDALALLAGIAADMVPADPTSQRHPNPEPIPPEASTLHLGAGASARSMLGDFPSPAATVLLGVAPRGPGGWLVRTGVTGAIGGGSTATTTFVFDLLTVFAEGCAPDVAGLPVTVQPCLSVEAGLIAARGHAAASSDAHVVPWGSAASKLDLTWPRSTRVRGTLEGGARFAPFRHRYFAGQDSTLYVTPVVGGELGAFVTVDLR